MNKIIGILQTCFGDNIYRSLFITLGVCIQIVAYILSPDNVSWLSLFSGITGIFAVVLCAERNMSYYIFAWPQLISYVILAYQQRLYGEIYENIFYAITMIIGMLIWFKHFDTLKSGQYKVESRELSRKTLILLVFGSCIAIYLLGWYLSKTDDSQPYMDAITTIPAFIAQILLTFRYREQWLFWMVINVGSIFMWANAHDYCMVSQYVFWTVNCFLGYKCWKT